MDSEDMKVEVKKKRNLSQTIKDEAISNKKIKLEKKSPAKSVARRRVKKEIKEEIPSISENFASNVESIPSKSISRKIVKKKIKEEIPSTSENDESNVESFPSQSALSKKVKEEIKEEIPSTSREYKLKSVKKEEVWAEHELLSELENIKEDVAEKIIQLFNDGNTIPFIARYRRDVTGNMTAEQLRDIKESSEKISALKAKIQTVCKTIEKSGNMNVALKKAIFSARTVEELEHIYAPYKPGSKKTLAERAKAFGLEEPAMNLLENHSHFIAETYVDHNIKELSTVIDVEKGIIHIIAHVIATDTNILKFLRTLRLNAEFVMETKQMRLKRETSKTTIKTENKEKTKANDLKKFELYYNFKVPVSRIKPHQILAINRGEAQKALSVKVQVPEFLYKRYFEFCCNQWIPKGNYNLNRQRIIEEAIKDAYIRLGLWPQFW